MFIFLDALEFSPELPADGESEIRGIQIQRDWWGWSGFGSPWNRLVSTVAHELQLLLG